MPPDVAERIREHAAQAGLDVSTFLVIAAQAQMDQQDRVNRVLEPLRRAMAQAEQQGESGEWLGDTIELTEAEQGEVNAMLGLPNRPASAA
jgi:hypothetical protein